MTERECFRGLERWPLLFMTKCPVPSLVGLWHVASGQGVGLPRSHPVSCLWPLWEVRIWGFGSWDTCPGCFELGPRPQACARSLVAIRC